MGAAVVPADPAVGVDPAGADRAAVGVRRADRSRARGRSRLVRMRAVLRVANRVRVGLVVPVVPADRVEIAGAVPG